MQSSLKLWLKIVWSLSSLKTDTLRRNSEVKKVVSQNLTKLLLGPMVNGALP